jgi:hypothetical protein
MPERNFIKDAVSFVNEYLPHANWELEKDRAALLLTPPLKSILFLNNTALHMISESLHSHIITEYSWNKNQLATQSRICSILGVTSRIHARQTIVKKISKAVAKIFVDTNHMMGYAQSHLSYGLFTKDAMVAVACFSKGRKMDRLPTDKRSYELVRFCSKNFHTVVGGLSKLIHHFEKERTPGDIMTYVDRTCGEPHAYYALGFVLDKVSEPLTISIMKENEIKTNFTNKGNYKLIKHLL